MHDASERLFMDQVVQLAKAAQWLTFHTVPFQVRPGVWRSSGKGFPDLVMVCPYGRGTIFAELKIERGVMSDEQVSWGEALIKSGAEFYVWKPRDLQTIAKRLTCTRHEWQTFLAETDTGGTLPN